MNNPIIKVENLSKRYRIGTRENGYKTFREAVIEGFTAPIRSFKASPNATESAQGNREKTASDINLSDIA